MTMHTSLATASFEELEAALEAKKTSRIEELRESRRQLKTQMRTLERDLDQLDAAIDEIRGTIAKPARREGRSGTKAPSGQLRIAIDAVLMAAEGPLGPTYIAERMVTSGYQWANDSLNVTVSQRLARGAKDGIYERQGRGEWVITDEGRTTATS